MRLQAEDEVLCVFEAVFEGCDGAAQGEHFCFVKLGFGAEGADQGGGGEGVNVVCAGAAGGLGLRLGLGERLSESLGLGVDLGLLVVDGRLAGGVAGGGGEVVSGGVGGL